MIGRLLQVRHGEGPRVVLLFTYLFLVIASYVVTRNTRDAIFMERFPVVRLTYVDMASAVLAGAVMAVYLRISRRAGLRALLVGTLLVSSAAAVGFWFVARVREPVWMIPVLYLWASVSGVLLPAQVWTLANHVMTTREAKRLFGVLGGGAIAGGIVGGFLTTIARRIGAANLLLMTAATLAICPLLVLAIWRERKIDRVPARGNPDGSEAPFGVKESVSLVWRSRHLRTIAALIGLSSLVTYCVAWQFKAVAKASISDTDQLAAFFGTFDMYAGSLALAAQLLLTSRLLRRFGLGATLLVVPVALAAGSLGLLLTGGLLAAVMLRGTDRVLRYSIDRSSVELLYLPVPAPQMTRAKALIDTVVWRIGDGAGSLVVLAAVMLAGLTAPQISLLTLVLLAGWLAAAIAAGRYYVESLRSRIYEHRLDAERVSVLTDDRSATGVLTDALGGDDPAHVLYALTLLESRDPPMSHPAVGRLLDHGDPAVRRQAIALLAATEEATALARVQGLLHDEDQGVRAEALVYLARCGGIDPLADLGEVDPAHGSAVASAIAHFLARPGPSQNMDAVRLLLEVATAGTGPESYRARLEAARLIGSLPDRFEEQLNALLKDPAPDVARLAIRAAASIGKSSSVPLVVVWLADPDLAGDAADSLAALGDRAVPALRDTLGHPQTSAGVRHLIPPVLQRIATPAAEQALVEHLLDADPVLRLRAVSALNKVRQLAGDRRLEGELVETILAAEILGHYRSYQLLGRLREGDRESEAGLARVKESMDREIERIFRLIKLLLPDHDLHSAYVGLQSLSPTVHANALEFLEHALPARLRTLLLPLIDSEVSCEDRIRLAERMVGATRETSEQALAAFAASDKLLRDAAREAERQLETRA